MFALLGFGKCTDIMPCLEAKTDSGVQCKE